MARRPRRWPPLLDMTPEQRADHSREDARYLARHGDCRAHRQSVAGNRTQHCGYCCPPPPLSAEQVETVARLLSGRSAQPDPASLMVWEVTHTCGHTVRRKQHRDHREWNLYFAYECQECDGEIRGVISAVQISLMSEAERGEEPASQRAAAAGPKPPSKAVLRRRLREAEAHVKSLRIQLAQLDEPVERAAPGRHPERDPE